MTIQLSPARVSTDKLARRPHGDTAQAGADLVATPMQGAFPTKNEQIAEQFTALFDDAVGGVRRMMVFGAAMHQLPSVLELQNAHSMPNQYTPKDQTLKGWIEVYCPRVNYNSAYAMYRLALGMCTTLKISPDVNLHKLLTANSTELSTEESSIRKTIEEAISGKSARQLEWDFGVRKARDEDREYGGARAGSGRPKYSQEKEHLQIEATFSKKILGNISVAVLEKRWHLRVNQDKQDILAAIAMAIAEDLGDPTLRKAIKEARSRSLLVQP